MTLSIDLRQAIERWARELRDTSALSALVQQKQLTPRALAFYLESLRHLFQNSERNLPSALRGAEALGDAELAEHFRRKIAEEDGHDLWAASDLAKLPAAITAGQRPAQGVLDLLALQRQLIAEHPLYFAVYILWAEYFTVLLGDDWLEALASCGFPRAQVTAIAKHVEADREHARESFDEIDRLWHGEPAPELLLQAVARAGRLFEAFCDEICAEARRAA
jgi:hypothetical protein